MKRPSAGRPLSLTARLVATSVMLVAMVSVVIGAAAFGVIRDTLYRQLDSSVLATVGVSGDDASRGGRHDDDHDHDPPMPPTAGFDGNVGPGTLVVLPDRGIGYVAGDRRDDQSSLPLATVTALDQVPADRRPHTVDIARLGTYRVASGTDPFGSRVIVGLPTENLHETLTRLLIVEVAVIGLALAGATAAGLVSVRRQLRPLREVAATAHQVAELPLATGEIDLSARVPESLTDERTEVGQVGSALNRMLSHVESSLEARHRSEQQVRQFVADASHELRTPLATIAGYSELARRKPEDVAGLRTALDKVEAESGRMTALVSDLLLLARLDAGRPLEREPVDLTLILVEAVTDARVLAPTHQWRLELPEEPVEVPGDARALHQAVTNLITNARRYTPDGTTVTVGVRPERDADGATLWQVSVHDDGPGFTPELAAHAFERFVRGDQARTRDGSTGLGLALVQAIATAHDGSVFLESAPGDTRIGFRLPA